MPAAGMVAYGSVCGWTLARAHARSGDHVAIAAYLGSSDRFDEAVADLAEAYAKLNEVDFTTLQRAARDGQVKVEAGL
jgi:NAD(P)-dependent dehydrogenase (short-subunit alcohol dehydrogenase family)